MCELNYRGAKIEIGVKLGDQKSKEAISPQSSLLSLKVRSNQTNF